ncbi:hypothetical protein [Aquabacterium sp.]|uniref:hypothetical protein n=1 Tax=Aquabacterium sp. TaxID=1872578 RepID=UPI002C63F295|nr:hypothetical protein [Aquabacterium sp.]HSW03008.1 hypothetical protein [Aquabacterium sp.]
MPQLSGPVWVNRFPTSTSVSDLSAGFAASVNNFIAALEAGGASVSIAATLRPPQRAHLMHYAWKVGRESMDPATVPAMAGVDIDWVHRNRRGQADLTASRSAALGMVGLYGIVYAPALASRHTEGRAIDMTISNYVNHTVTDGGRSAVRITSAAALHTVGASFGVIKLVSDPPHWSDDGH